MRQLYLNLLEPSLQGSSGKELQYTKKNYLKNTMESEKQKGR